MLTGFSVVSSVGSVVSPVGLFRIIAFLTYFVQFRSALSKFSVQQVILQ